MICGKMPVNQTDKYISDLESEIQYLKKLLDENGISYDYEAHLRALQSDVGDIVFPKYGVAIMVNGCFWHGHKGCRYATKPKTNIEFWETKIARNRHRDEITDAHLQALGWYVITIWECELRDASSAISRLDVLVEEIRKAGELKWEYHARKHYQRLLLAEEKHEMLKRRSFLKREIAAMYKVPTKIVVASEEELSIE